MNPFWESILHYELIEQLVSCCFGRFCFRGVNLTVPREMIRDHECILEVALAWI